MQPPTPLTVRPLSIQTHVLQHSDGSAFIQAGNTQVLCVATLQPKVPSWLQGQQMGWIKAEYNLLPCSTRTRTPRERDQISGRTQEIQRLISRSLRSIVHLNQLGERTVLIDCDVIQADGGTRTACITGGCVALTLAIQKLIQANQIPSTTLRDLVAGISLGLMQKEILVDLNYEQDSKCDVDMNFVITGQGELVEIQGTGEKTTFSQVSLFKMVETAFSVIQQIHHIQRQAIHHGLTDCNLSSPIKLK